MTPWSRQGEPPSSVPVSSLRVTPGQVRPGQVEKGTLWSSRAVGWRYGFLCPRTQCLPARAWVPSTAWVSAKLGLIPATRGSTEFSPESGCKQPCCPFTPSSCLPINPRGTRSCPHHTHVVCSCHGKETQTLLSRSRPPTLQPLGIWMGPETGSRGTGSERWGHGFEWGELAR